MEQRTANVLTICQSVIFQNRRRFLTTKAGFQQNFCETFESELNKSIEISLRAPSFQIYLVLFPTNCLQFPPCFFPFLLNFSNLTQLKCDLGRFTRCDANLPSLGRRCRIFQDFQVFEDDANSSRSLCSVRRSLSSDSSESIKSLKTNDKLQFPFQSISLAVWR